MLVSGIVNIEVIPSLTDGHVIWQTNIQIKCSWSPPDAYVGEILIDGNDAWSSPQYGTMVGLNGT